MIAADCKQCQTRNGTVVISASGCFAIKGAQALSPFTSCCLSPTCLPLWLRLFVDTCEYITLRSTIDSGPALVCLIVLRLNHHSLLPAPGVAWHLEPSLFDSYRRSSSGRRRCLCPPEYSCLLSLFEGMPWDLLSKPVFKHQWQLWYLKLSLRMNDFYFTSS